VRGLPGGTWRRSGSRRRRPQRGRQITCPLLAPWGIRDDLADLYDNDVLGVWGPWASDLSGHGLDSAHHIAEAAPQELTHALLTTGTPLASVTIA
jgi:hypothetical protein